MGERWRLQLDICGNGSAAALPCHERLCCAPHHARGRSRLSIASRRLASFSNPLCHAFILFGSAVEQAMSKARLFVAILFAGLLATPLVYKRILVNRQAAHSLTQDS